MSKLSEELRESAKATFYNPLKSELNRTADHIDKLEEALESLAYIHDGNPSDAYASVPELDYARHMLWEVRQIARNALKENK